MNLNARALRAHAFNARVLIISTVFLVSACVIGTSKEPDATVKAEPEKTVPAKPAAKMAEKPIAKKAVEKPLPAPVMVAKATAKPKVAPTHVAVKPKVPRYVDADILNVRARPSYTAPIVAKLTRGTMFAVALHGEWAEISSGQYVLAKFLTKSLPH